MCVDCGKRMGEKKPTIVVCSPECASRQEARKKPRLRANEPGDTAKISLGNVAAAGLARDDKKRR